MAQSEHDPIRRPAHVPGLPWSAPADRRQLPGLRPAAAWRHRRRAVPGPAPRRRPARAATSGAGAGTSAVPGTGTGTCALGPDRCPHHLGPGHPARAGGALPARRGRDLPGGRLVLAGRRRTHRRAASASPPRLRPARWWPPVAGSAWRARRSASWRSAWWPSTWSAPTTPVGGVRRPRPSSPGSSAEWSRSPRWPWRARRTDSVSPQLVAALAALVTYAGALGATGPDPVVDVVAVLVLAGAAWAGLRTGREVLAYAVRRGRRAPLDAPDLGRARSRARGPDARRGLGRARPRARGGLAAGAAPGGRSSRADRGGRRSAAWPPPCSRSPSPLPAVDEGGDRSHRGRARRDPGLDGGRVAGPRPRRLATAAADPRARLRPCRCSGPC